MRVLIVSDTHGYTSNLEKVLLRVQPDVLYHLGDIQGQESYIQSIYNCPMELVRGNCDMYSTAPNYVITALGRHHVYLTHGHEHFVKYGTSDLAKAATEAGCDVVMYGHTHYPEIIETPQMTIVNPGSISLPRQSERKPSFVVLDVDKTGEFHFSMNYLED